MSTPAFTQLLTASAPRYTTVSTKFLALYFALSETAVHSISRPGRTKAYSPARRMTITTTNTANVGASASHRKPAAAASGTATSSTPTPSRCAMRPVRNSWDRIASACTMASMVPKTWVWRVLSGNAASTSRACSKYRKVVTLASSTTNRAMPSMNGERSTSAAPASGLPPRARRRIATCSGCSGRASRQRCTVRAENAAASSRHADRNSSPACPIGRTRATPSSGPTRPPALAPAAISANRRLAWATANRSTSTLHATEMAIMLNTDSQM